MSRSAYGALSAPHATVATSVAEAPTAERTIVDVLETDEARVLLEAGRHAGSLTTDEITLGLDELDLDTDQLDDFYQALEELHIDIVDNAAAPADDELDLD